MKGPKLILALVPLMICYVVSLNKSFFWDTIHLASAQANWFYDIDLQGVLLPDGIDSGHPPLTGWLLALIWKIFGKGLIQSHLLMLPFLATAMWQMKLVLQHYFPERYTWFAIIFFLNPILLSQAMLVSPDIILFSGFFLMLHGILVQKNGKIILGSIILAAVSMRGMMCVASLAFFDLWLHRDHVVKRISRCIPAGAVAGGFLLYHYMSKGWIGYHPGSPWAPSFEPAGLTGFLRNVAVTAWRFCDQGMLFLWLIFLLPRSWSARSPKLKQLLALLVILFTMLVLPQLFYKGLLMHRYLYPCIAVLSLIAFAIAEESMGSIKRYVVFTSLLLVSGFFWIYPDHISKGWDVMPLHVTYYAPRQQIMKEIKALGIDPQQTGAGFPYEMPSSIIDLGTDERNFASPDLSTNKFVLYSNVSNDFTEEQLQQLKQWKILASSGSWPIRFVLYGKP